MTKQPIIQPAEQPIITLRQIRAILFNVNNQELTVRELRHLLFSPAEHDTLLTPTQVSTAINELEILKAS